MENTITDKIQLAADFVNSTSSHIFLTGKAGTGKTTFLRQLSLATHKTHIIVAPTGIAALNAGGVTIHSQFLLPFGCFLPDPNSRGVLPEDSLFYNAFMLRSKRRNLNRERLKVLRGIDLLIIDEVSMLRADLLDAIDLRLRSARGNALPFGGVQLLMIGDLYQLPPIVKETEQKMLEQYYPSPFFFHSLALKNAGYVYIELDKIFRQQDDKFIRLLNNLRNDCATRQDLELLNSYYKPNYSPEDNEEVTHSGCLFCKTFPVSHCPF